MNRPKISVVVCTYNRAALLPVCLQSLADQTADKSLYEVIVVNNNSTDETQKIAEDFSAPYQNFRVVREPQQGLSRSRNRGWREAKGKYVAYIDDDAKACPDWLEIMLSFTQRHPEVAAFGGPYDAFSLVNLPSWLPPEAGSSNLNGNERPIKVGAEWISGTNMVFTKEILSSVGGFNTELGMSGSKISYGEETRLLLDLDKKNVVIYYVPEMKVQHLIADYKMNLKWQLLSWYSNGRCSPLSFNRRRSLFSHLRGLLLSIIRMSTALFSVQRMPLKRRIYYSLAFFFSEIGELVDYFSTLKKK